MIIDIHFHAWEKFSSTEGTVGGLNWINRQLIPKHPYIAPDKVRDYYSNFTPERFLKEHDEAGIDIAVIHTGTHEHVYENYLKKYPERFIAFASVQPLNQFRRFRKECLEELKNAIEEYGFKGLGELVPPYQNISPSDPKFYPLYNLCLELGIPVSTHVAATPYITSGALEYGRPVLFEQAADDFHEVDFCICHMGYPWTEELMALMDKRVNVWTDVAHLCVHRFMLAWYLVMAKDYQVIDRVMFGTDGSCRPPINYVNWFKFRLNEICERAGWPTFTKEEIDGILGENAVRFLKLK